jgi:hypothetical protein
MERYGVPFHPNNSHIRCLAHVVNLVVQKMLSVAKEVDDPDFQDYYEHLNKQFPVHYDLDGDEELHDFENEEDDGSKAHKNDIGDGLVDQECGEQDHFSEMGAIEKVSLMQSMLSSSGLLNYSQLRTAIVKIVGTPGRRQLFCEKARQYYSLATHHSKKGVITQVAALMPVRDVRMRWNSTHAMIKRAWILRKVRRLDNITVISS